MNNKVPALTDNQTFEEVISCLEKSISLDTQGECDRRTIFEILLRAASANDSIENTCNTLSNVPCSNDIRYHLDKYDSMENLESQLNDAIQSRLPPKIKNGKQRLAIDFNLIPYYGVPTPEEAPYIIRSQAKAGTCSFYAYATVYVIKKGKRVTIALTSVRNCDTEVFVITRLLDKISQINLKIKRLYLDRGFFNVPVIRWLKALDIPFEMPVVIRGQKAGTRQLLKGGKSYKTTYTMKSQKYGSVTFDIWVVCTYSKGKYKKDGIKYFAYAVYKVGIGLKAIFDDYRKRFGIETSYRVKNQCRIKTTTKNPIVRMLFYGISFILTDMWVYLTWTHISLPKKGGRQLFCNLFPLKLMLTFLCQVIERKYPVKDCVYLE